MTKEEWAKAFEEGCKKWQTRLGLTDWSLRYTTGKPGRNIATVDYNQDTRRVTATAYVNDDMPEDPERVALHEMLHILFADFVAISAARASDMHPDVVREEHRMIERLLTAMPA